MVAKLELPIVTHVAPSEASASSHLLADLKPIGVTALTMAVTTVVHASINLTACPFADLLPIAPTPLAMTTVSPITFQPIAG